MERTLMTFNEWMDEYYGHLYNMYQIYVKYTKETSTQQNFKKFCIFVSKTN
jgi:hypothetical protein